MLAEPAAYLTWDGSLWGEEAGAPGRFGAASTPMPAGPLRPELCSAIVTLLPSWPPPLVDLVV